MPAPAIIPSESITGITAKFIIAVISVTRLSHLSEVGSLIPGSKLPLNIPELFVIFIERTIISTIIVCLPAYLIPFS